MVVRASYFNALRTNHHTRASPKSETGRSLALLTSNASWNLITWVSSDKLLAVVFRISTSSFKCWYLLSSRLLSSSWKCMQCHTSRYCWYQHAMNYYYISTKLLKRHLALVEMPQLANCYYNNKLTILLT